MKSKFEYYLIAPSGRKLKKIHVSPKIADYFNRDPFVNFALFGDKIDKKKDLSKSKKN